MNTYFEDYLELENELARFELEEDYRRHPEQYQDPKPSNTKDLFYTYLRLYPNKADEILATIREAEANGEDPEAAILARM